MNAPSCDALVLFGAPRQIAIAIGAMVKRYGTQNVGDEVDLYACDTQGDEMEAYERLSRAQGNSCSAGHEPDSPRLKIEVHADVAAVSRRAAALVAEASRRAIAQRDRFVLALSGGNTPRAMLRMLAAESIDWHKVHLTQVDERVAPVHSRERNLSDLREFLLARIALPAEQFHPMPVDDDADLPAAAERHARLLERLAGAPPLLDLVQLGLGADGHTASLVPGDPVLDVTDNDVAVAESYQGCRRMTLTLPIINRALCILWLVTGEQKADALARMVQGDPSLPASRVRQASALLLADHDAARLASQAI